MQKKINIIFIIILLVGCNHLNESKGDYNEIIIVTSNEDKRIIQTYVDKMFYGYINTPHEEKIYNTKWINIDLFKDYLNYKNILFVSLEDPSDSTIDLINSKFIEQYNTDISSISELYSKDQTVLFFKSDDISDFKIKLDNYSKWILEQFDANIYSNIKNRIIYNGENRDLSTYISENFNLDIYTQKDYEIIQSDSLDKFLWIGRGYPYRWISFFKYNTNERSNYNTDWDFYTNLLDIYMPNVSVSDYYRKNIYDDKGRLALIRGLYEEDFSDTGGPFFVKFFKLDDENNIYISGFVNNPGKNKYILLKELELIITEIKIKGKENE